MEDTLRGSCMVDQHIVDSVLILVLMEDTLRGHRSLRYHYQTFSLNPCFNGRYSQSLSESSFGMRTYVLILVLMEDTLREQNLRILEFRGFDKSKTYKIGFY